MPSLFGIDIAGIVAREIGPGVLPATLILPAPLGARDEDDLLSGPTRGASTRLSCRGFKQNYNPREIDGSLIKSEDIRILLIAGTIEGGSEPVDNCSVEIEGTLYNIPRVEDRDPAGATFTLQARRA